jgi:hypothetical protein
MSFVGAAGNAILFLFAFIGAVLVGLITLSYAAHSFLVVLECTAWGEDDVRWPDEPIVDWLWKLWYLLWLVAFWLVPLWFLIDGVVLPALGRHAVGFAPVLVLALWLLFPVSIFSSLSGGSRWVVFRPAVLRRLAHHVAALLAVYVLGGGLVVGASVLFFRALLWNSWLLVPLAAMAGAAVLLIYARLCGRVAWLVIYRTSEKPAKRPKRKKKKAAGRTPPAEPGPAPEAPPPAEAERPLSPPALDLAEEEDEWAPATPYALSSSSVPPPPPPRPRPFEEPEPGYNLSEDTEPPAARPLPFDGYTPVGLPPLPPLEGADRVESANAAIAGFEQRLAQRHPEIPPPAHPLWSGVYSFPWYYTSFRAWLCLSFGGLVLTTLLRGVLLTWPF